MTDHVTTWETSEQLKAAGFPQETELCWWRGGVYKRDSVLAGVFDFPNDTWISAPLLTEILEGLPEAWTLSKEQLTIGYNIGIPRTYRVSNDSMVEAAAQLWLKLNNKAARREAT